jgi:hypothetical protein
MEPSPAAVRVLEFVLQVALVVVTPLAAWFVARMIKVFEAKAKIDIPAKQEEAIQNLVTQGIALAEEKARKAVQAKASSITGPEKLEIAADHVLDLIEAKKWDAWTRDKVKNLIEAKIGMARPSNHVVLSQ